MAKAMNLDATVIDAASFFDAGEALGERFGRARVTVDYARLRQRLESLRSSEGWRPASVNSIILSIDPNSEGQKRFQAMLAHSGFDPDVVFFRDSFISLPPGQSPREATTQSSVSLAARISYIAGLMARYSNPHFLTVTHSFELFGPLTDLADRVPSGKVGLAYFGSLLDYRWRLAGLFERKLKVEFFDLDPFGQELVGIDLVGKPPAQADVSVGLSRF